MSSLKESTKAVQDIHLSLEQNHSVEVLEDVSGDDNRQGSICLP